MGVNHCPSPPIVTLAGVELAHRIRKRQHFLQLKSQGRGYSLKELWDRALRQACKRTSQDSGDSPLTHQISPANRQRTANVRISRLGRVRSPRKISFGGSLYLLVMPTGGRYWRYCYCYRYSGKQKTLAIGVYPGVPIARARSRHRVARQLLAAGVDPSLKRKELRRVGRTSQ